jgi:thiol-disulfide isomerase/thioredoxin
MFKQVISSKKIVRFSECLFVFCVSIFTACQHSDTDAIPLDKARIIGKYAEEIYHKSGDDTVRTVRIVSLPLFRDMYQQEVRLSDDGTFTVDVPVVYPTMCEANLVDCNSVVAIYLTPGKETQFELNLDETGDKALHVITGTVFSQKMFDENQKVFLDIYSAVQRDWVEPGEEYDKYIIDNLENINKKADENPNALYETKQILKQKSKWYFLYSLIEPGSWAYPPPERPMKKVSDFSFLQYFDLNDSTVFHEANYYFILRKILADEILNIPPVGETPVVDWLKGVKSIMSGLIGSDSGMFYDLLAANAYFRHLEKLKPFSVKQIENIKTYFPGKTYLDLLLDINEKTVEIDRVKKNTIPDVPQKELMEAIISKYKGKVVVVNFWATWYEPCLTEMEASKMMKNNLKDKDVVFVYIANATANLSEWQKISEETGGEHYILATEDYRYILFAEELFAFSTYRIYDANGVLKHNLAEFPGVDKMEEMIEKQLK